MCVPAGAVTEEPQQADVHKAVHTILHLTCFSCLCLQVLWLKSRNSEVWLDRRTSYTRSAAVMSMVRKLQVAAAVVQQQGCTAAQFGYIPGLGNRHPPTSCLTATHNRTTHKLVHIFSHLCTGWLHPGPGRPPPLQPHAGPLQRQAAAH